MSVSSTCTYEVMALDKTPELPLWLEVIVSFEHQNIGHFLLRSGDAGVKCIANVMSHSIRRLEQQQHLICVCTFDAVAGCNPSCILQKDMHRT